MKFSLFVAYLGCSLATITHPLFEEWSEFNKKMRKAFIQEFTDAPAQDSLIQHATSHAHEPQPQVVATIPVKLEDIKGVVPQEIYDLRDYLLNSQYYIDHGITMAKGILLVGAPGTGKTTIARALAASVDVPFIYASGSEFVEIFVGVGASRIRELFKKAREQMAKTGKKHAIIFIDEIDAIGVRSNGFGGSSEDNRTIDELLTQMDGFTKEGNITVIAATNQVSLVDQALRRPGRFDEIIEIPLPDEKTRLEILLHYLYDPRFKRTVQDSISLDSIARKTQSWSGAELEGLVKKAAHQAVRHKRSITQEDLEKAYQQLASMHKVR